MSNQQRDEKLPLSEIGPAETYNAARKDKAINPLDPSSMPRAEDDEQTYERSPEYHDRPEPTPNQK
jgi:hypothetical protein